MTSFSNPKRTSPHIGPRELYPFRKLVYGRFSRHFFFQAENENGVGRFSGTQTINYIFDSIEGLD